MEVFTKMRDELIRKHHGKTAIFHNGKLIVIEKDLKRALKKPERKLNQRRYS